MKPFKVGSTVEINGGSTIGIVLRRKGKRQLALVFYVNAAMNRAECYWFAFSALHAVFQ